jgi:hypothetical protein
MYGSHYSSAGLVLHYLMRQEPFTTLAIRLQSGSFDCPDRLFFDVNSSWVGCHRSTTDVKELVPEFFSVPEMLINSNRYPLGTLDDERGEVNDVRLPPWARNAYDFVRINRLALESEHVSQNLHHWIDLIFGFKQKGEEAIKAHNVFYYLTYEGAVDIDAIDDPLVKDATEAQVCATHWLGSRVLISYNLTLSLAVVGRSGTTGRRRPSCWPRRTRDACRARSACSRCAARWPRCATCATTRRRTSWTSRGGTGRSSAPWCWASACT